MSPAGASAPVCVARQPEGVEREWPANCHVAERRPTAVIVELGNTGSTHKVLLCDECAADLFQQLAILDAREGP